MSLHLPLAPEPATTRDDSFLDRIGVATPCDAAWDDMKGNERVRFCGHCKLNVYNLSAMPRVEAANLVREREGRLCVRLFKRVDGTLITEDCWTKLRRARKKGAWAFVCALAVVAATQLFANAFGLRLAWNTLKPREPAHVLAGAIAMQGGPTLPMPLPMMGEPVALPPREVKGEILMGKIATPPKAKPAPKARPLMGRVAHHEVELMGDIAE